MTTVLSVLDTLSFAVIAWTAYAITHDRHEVRTWRDAWLTLALIATWVFAACGMIASPMQTVEYPWYLRNFLYSVAFLSAWMYDHRFGIVRHLGMLRRAVVKAWERRPGHRGSA